MFAYAINVPPEIKTMGIVRSEAVRNTVKSEEIVYTNPDKRWNKDMCLTSGPKRQKFNFSDV